MIATPKNGLKARLGSGFRAQFRTWVGLDIELGTTRICSTTAERLRNLLEVR